jgi:S1-C subfamily serine protease
VEIGTEGVTTDKVMVDLDSVETVDGFRVARIMTLFNAPRTNAHDITFDRRVQRTAFDCAGKMAAGIRTFGFMGEKQVGSSPETADWRNKLRPIGTDPMNNRALALICGAPAPGGPPAAQRPKTTTGSGVVVDPIGDVLTANHVVQHCKSISVQDADSSPVEATVVGTDPKNDLAILKIAAALGEPAHFRSSGRPAKLGESIGVIGYPLTGFLSSEPKATFGQVNSIAGFNNDYTLLQISAPVQPGNSGGPVLDESGQVIGVVVSQASLAVVAQSGNVPQNVNFAVRGEVAQIFLAARGIKVATSARQHVLSTEALAARGLKSTVFVKCSAE